MAREFSYLNYTLITMKTQGYTSPILSTDHRSSVSLLQVYKISVSASLLLVLFVILTRSRHFRSDIYGGILAMKAYGWDYRRGLRTQKRTRTREKVSIPWKYGIPVLSELDFFHNDEIFLRRGFKKLGDVFAFRFLKVSQSR